MKTLNRLVIVGGVSLVVFLGAGPVSAQQRQGRGNADIEQFRQRMMERYREELEVKSDDEWKVIQGRIEKVVEARREVGLGGPMGGMAFGRGGRRGGDGPDQQSGGNGQGGRRAFGGGTPSPEAEALQKAVESKASADELKAKLAQYREARKEKQAKLEKAQDELRKLFSVRQEASAVLMGLLQ